MLKVMRGYTDDPLKNPNQLPPTQKIAKDNPNYFDEVGKNFGIDENFIAYIDTLDDTTVRDLLAKERSNSIEVDENSNEVDLNLDDESEFDADFVQDVHDEFANLF